MAHSRQWDLLGDHLMVTAMMKMNRADAGFCFEGLACARHQGR